MEGRFVGPVGLADVDVLVDIVVATGRDEETMEADERLVDVEDETTELDDAAGGIESRPGVYFVRS
jgi:hypothetical protein